MRIRQQPARSLSWTEREDEMVDLRVKVPKEEAAVLIAASNAAKDQFGAPPRAPVGVSATPTPKRTQTPVRRTGTSTRLTRRLAEHVGRPRYLREINYDEVDSMVHPDAEQIVPRWPGSPSACGPCGRAVRDAVDDGR